MNNLEYPIEIDYVASGVVIRYPKHEPGKTDYVEFDEKARLLTVKSNVDSDKFRFTLLINSTTCVIP